MADDATLVTGVREVRGDMMPPIGIGNIFGSKIRDQ
jgi:hypothetical protein